MTLIDTPTSSGLSEFFYPTLGFHELIETSKIKRVPIPNELVEQYRSNVFIYLLPINKFFNLQF